MDRELKAYLRALRKELRSGEATEHSYRPALKTLIEAVGPTGIQAVNEPTQGEYGAPDFIVHNNGVPVGHVECKNIGADLDEVEQSAQLLRYRDALPNLILTDYVEFRWYVNGERQALMNLARSGDDKLKVLPNALITVGATWESFFNADFTLIANAADLARRMANKTRLLREHIHGILKEDEAGIGLLSQLLESYREVLISGLGADRFADLQAQTVAYGLFAARWLHQGAPADFTRKSAIFEQTTPFLQNVFNQVAGPTADPRITWIVDDLARLLARADMAAVLEGFGERTWQQDPIIHFYEDFLAIYDPELKEQRGVYYTPEPVVSYIVRSVDKILRDQFQLADGLADTSTVITSGDDGNTQASHRVLILDPAVGTGSFLREVVSTIRSGLDEKGRGGAWSQYVSEHLLPRLFGFELMMAPYAIAHLKLAMEIEGDSRSFLALPDRQLNIFLTNSLEEAHESARGPAFAAEVAREARQADAVKRDRPVMVVIGNPPYSGHSANKGKWIKDLLRGRVEGSPTSYFHVDGEPLGERNSKWLNDDYVKFIRFAQWRIEQTGEGVLGFITNHSYLDSPTFRGMRKSLIETFDEIYVLDLHGSSKRAERLPDGSLDQNVFDIQQGVAISIFVKRNDDRRPATVHHADLRGERNTGDGGGKYSWLATHDVATTGWTKLTPRSPFYFFVPRDDELIGEYEAGWSVSAIFPVNSVGIVTARDKLAIQWTADEMAKVASNFAALDVEDAREHYNLGRDVRDWKVSLAQTDIRDHPNTDDHVARVLYRPFDTRYTYWTGRSRGFICMPRPKTLRHMLAGPNIGLLSCRQQSQQGDWQHCGVTRGLIESCAISNKTREINYLFPLYTYPPGEDSLDLNVPESVPNLAPEFVAEVAAAFDLEFTPEGGGDLEATFGPEDVFRYIYAVLHSPEYRSRYADFLKSDFPRVPLPDRRKGRYIRRLRRGLFAQLAELGARLAALHLMEAVGDEQPVFSAQGTNLVERVRYVEPIDGDPGRVYINATQHFEGVAPETWEFTIGGYQPAQKWLKDRRGRELSYDDIAHYQRICAALAETPQLMSRIDEVVDAHGGWPLSGAE